MTKLKVYVDGSYNPSTNHWGSAAIILDNNNFILDEILEERIDGYGSRQIAGECFSTINALETIYKNYNLEKIDEIEIFYDYLGIEKWARSEWQAKSDVAIEYSKIVKRLMTLLRFEKHTNVIFKKVKAHSSDHFNDRVDGLAKMSCGVELGNRKKSLNLYAIETAERFFE